MIKQTLITIVLSSILVGCGTTDYPCGEPSAGACRSVSQNDKASYSNYLNPDDVDAPGFWGGTNKDDASTYNPNTVKMNFKKYTQVPIEGAPLLSNSKMIRVWLTPYTDSDNIYHDQSYEYMIVDKGRWNYSNNRILNDDEVQNVTMGQVSEGKSGGYGSYGLADQPPKQNTPQPGFPAINTLQNQQAPVITTISTDAGVNRATTITP